MRNNRIPQYLVFLAAVVLPVAGLIATPMAEVQTYVETFSTSQYKDTLNTSAFWDTTTGTLGPHPIVPDGQREMSNIQREFRRLDGNNLFALESRDCDTIYVHAFRTCGYDSGREVS